jgi:hypothetical protein
MTHWFDEEAEQKGLAGALKNLLLYARHPAGNKDLQSQVRCQTVTAVSVNAVMKLFAGWGVEASTYFITLEQLTETAMPHVSFILDTINEKECQWPILVTALEDDMIRYVHPVKGVIVEPIVSFSQKWNNVVIAVRHLTQSLN